MTRSHFAARIRDVFGVAVEIEGNFAALTGHPASVNQRQTKSAFSDKWARYASSGEKEGFYAFQREWYFELYGFAGEAELRAHLRRCEVILDAGCGLGYKSAWLARLAPEALVIAMDLADVAQTAAHTYSDVPNLLFVQGDIAATGLRDGVVDYVNCDQVIMHTDSYQTTFTELTRVTRPQGGQISCYFYAEKALPRELLDDHFRRACSELSPEELWRMSEQLTELGRRLSALNVSIDVPDIPALGIKGGTHDIQRFVYWNFLKCFWNESLGRDTSIATNFDWYSPSNARRFSEDEVHALVRSRGLTETHFHVEEACYSGRFTRER